MRAWLWLAFFALACSGPDLETFAARGAEVLRPFRAELQSALRDGLARGPAEAIQVCRLQAPRLAEQASAPGVRVGRTSHRLRNPANAPEPWMEPLLALYLADPADTAPRAVPIEGGVGYVEAIRVQPLCLTCHGEAIAPEVAERIAALYPEDRATGFREGEFRGLFWVAFESD